MWHAWVRAASALAAVAIVLAACGGSTAATSPADGGGGGAETTAEPEAGDVVIVVRDGEFVPAELTVAAGTRLVVRNEGSTKHSLITDDVSSFNTTPFEPGGEEVLWATVPGTYPFHCEIHPSMKGTLTITE